MKKLFLILSFFLLLVSSSSFAQRSFQDLGEEKGVFTQYKWTRSNFFDKDSDAALILRLTNLGEKPVKVVFDIAFYRNQKLMYESQDNEICLRPGQSRRGSLSGLKFMAEGISLDMTEESWFSWDFSQIEVIEVESCD